MEKYFTEILKQIEPHPLRTELHETPSRAASALKFLTEGYQVNIKKVFETGLLSSNQNDLMLIKNIEFYSLCEHHLLPFFGKCHIAYLPNGHLLGLSKFAEIVDIFAHRLQIQENLCAQIADIIQQYLNPKGLAVIIEAQHLCMMMRGVQKQHASFATQKLLGSLKTDVNLQQQFFQLLRST